MKNSMRGAVVGQAPRLRGDPGPAWTGEIGWDRPAEATAAGRGPAPQCPDKVLP